MTINLHDHPLHLFTHVCFPCACWTAFKWCYFLWKKWKYHWLSETYCQSQFFDLLLRYFLNILDVGTFLVKWFPRTCYIYIQLCHLYLSPTWKSYQVVQNVIESSAINSVFVLFILTVWHVFLLLFHDLFPLILCVISDKSNTLK